MPPRLRAAVAAYPRPFWMLVVGTFVNRTGLVVLPFLALYLSGPRAFSVAQATAAVSLYGAGAFAGGFVGGWLSDRVGRRPVLLASLGGASLPMAAIPFAPSFAAVGGLVAAFGLLSEMYRPAVSAAVADLVPEAGRPRAYAIVYWAINLGAAVGPALGGLLAERSYLGLFVLEGATLFAYAVIVLVSVPETRPPTADGAERPRIDLGPVARDGALAALALAVLLTGIGFYQLFTTLPLAMEADGLSERYFGFVITVNGALIVLVGLPVAAWVGDRATGWPVPTAVALVALGLALQIPAHSFGAYAACAVVWTLGEMAFLPVVPTLVARMAPDDLRGSYQGVYHASWGLAKMIGPALGGLVFAGLGSAALWGGAAGLVAVAAVLVALLLPTLRRRFASPSHPPAVALGTSTPSTTPTGSGSTSREGRRRTA